ncbi:hypothetical protein KC346_g23388, partial [Hortaea werneckii]
DGRVGGGGGGGGGGGMLSSPQGGQGQGKAGYNPFTTIPGPAGSVHANVTAAVQPPNFASSPPHPPPFPTHQQSQAYQQQQQVQQPGYSQAGYAQGTGGPGGPGGASRHISHESAAFITPFPGGGGGSHAAAVGEGGRASPEAFAGLSAGFRFR